MAISPPAPSIDSPAALGTYIDRLNEEGVKVYRRLSPAVLIWLMEIACKQLAEYHAGREPLGQAPYGVSWAGEEKSANWFDTAREYTERWHHQQQIRLAVKSSGARGPGILTRELYYPVLDCFMRALPFTYRNVSAEAGTAIHITVSGECGGGWNLLRADAAWVLTEREQISLWPKRPSHRKLPGAFSPEALTAQQPDRKLRSLAIPFSLFLYSAWSPSYPPEIQSLE